MSHSIMIRVTAEDFDRWIAEHNGAVVARAEYGISDGPTYRDESQPDTVLLQLDVEDLERAKGWFQDERFRAAVARAGSVKREIFFAERR